MKRSKGKFGYVLFGVLVGVLISISILWWTGNNPFGEIHIFKNIKSYFSDLFKKSADDDTSNTKKIDVVSLKNNSSNKIKTGKPNPDSSYFDSTSIDFYDAAALDEFLASFNGKLPDSIKIDSFFKSQRNVDFVDPVKPEQGIAVKKDKLLFVLTCNVPGLDKLENSNISKADSLIIENGSSESASNILSVEFWKSPVNYKGYKTGKNKVILFGINANEKVSFKVFNNALYMKHRDSFFLIEKTYEFKPFSPVTNNQLISQLSK